MGYISQNNELLLHHKIFVLTSYSISANQHAFHT